MMNADRYAQIRELFLEVYELDAEGRRQALEQAGRTDPDLRGNRRPKGTHIGAEFGPTWGVT